MQVFTSCNTANRLAQPWDRIHEHFTYIDTLNTAAEPGLHKADALNGAWGESIPPSFVEPCIGLTEHGFCSTGVKRFNSKAS